MASSSPLASAVRPRSRTNRRTASGPIAASAALAAIAVLSVSGTSCSARPDRSAPSATAATPTTSPAVLADAKANGGSVQWLGELDLSKLHQDWGDPHRDASTTGSPIKIAGHSFTHGLGTHSVSRLDLDVNGATRFTASVGIDDDAEAERADSGEGRASVEFIVSGDGKELFRSGVMHHGDAAKTIDLPLAGVHRLSLRVTDGGDGNPYDHADWADAKLEFVGTAPVALALADSGATTVSTADIAPLTPKAGPQPRINGAHVFGARPGSPILLTIPCTGTRPITFSIDGQLPPGLKLDAEHGRITGSVADKGDFTFTVKASNSAGNASRPWHLVVDDAPGTLAKTPPMGWNSWNVWGMAIDDAKVRAAADAFVKTDLIDHGWTFINIDDGWANRSPRDRDPNFAGEPRDPDGTVRPNRKFPDMHALADYVHDQGLKIGIYSSPGLRTCGNVEGSYGYEKEDAATYAKWGIDYLKYDWCSYGDFFNMLRRREHTNLDEHKAYMAPYVMMRDALRSQHRDIVYSLCQYGWNNVWEWGNEVDGQLWRTTGDIQDNWRSMSTIGFGQNGHEKFAKPGNWNDPDMLVVGYVGWGPNVRATHLTPDEQYTHISLWSLLSAPLLIGCDLTRLDPFTYGLLTNDEVIDIDQDALGKQASRVAQDGDHEVWAKPLEDGSVAVGLFNRGDDAGEVSIDFGKLPFANKASGSLDVRDVWRQQPLGKFDGSFKANVASHGVVLVRISPGK